MMNLTHSKVFIDGTEYELAAALTSASAGVLPTAVFTRKGDWDASAGSFPGSGSAGIGWQYRCSVAGTVNGIAFSVGDTITALVDGASSSTYAGNWNKGEGAITAAEILAALGSSVGAGNVVGPASATDSTPAVFDGTTGKLLKNVSYATFRSSLGLAIGTDVQAYDAHLTAWAAVNPSSYSTTAQIAAAYQPLDGELSAIAGLTSAADLVPYFTGSGTAALMTVTSAGRALIDDASASAQRITLVLGNVDNTSDANKPVSTAQQTALDLKANLASPTFTGTVTAPNISNAGGQALTVTPTGNATSTKSSLSVQGAALQSSVREFLVNLGMTSNVGTGVGTPNGDKVTLYSGISGASGTGDIWAANILLAQQASSGSYNAQGIELDIDNVNAHRGESDGLAGLSAPITYGMTVTGASTFRITAALAVFSANKMFNRGIVFALDSIVQSTFQDLTSSAVSLDVRGSHTYGLDLRNGTFSGKPIRLPNNSSIGWRNAAGSADQTVLTLDGSDNIIIGTGGFANAVFTYGGVFAPATDNVTALGGTANRWSIVYATTLRAIDSQSAGTVGLRVQNTSIANVTTKLTAVNFYGTDTISTTKEAARIETVPADANYVGASLKVYTRAGDAVTHALTFGSDQSVKAVSPTGGIGYGTGAGGTVTQATSKATGVTLNKVTGQITLNNGALGADTTVSFTMTNSAIAATDILVFNHVSGGTFGAYTFNARAGSGSAIIDVRNITAGLLGEAIVIAFAVIKAVTS